MDKKINWKKQIKHLQRFCLNRGYQVEFTRDERGICYIFFDEKKIMIHNGQNLERQFYSLLHEIGHDIFAKSRGYKPLSYAQNKFSRSSLTSKISKIEEEFGAWQAALKVVEKNDYKINHKNFHAFKSSLLMTYVRWAQGAL